MVAAIAAIIVALISYFSAKKSGASDGQAALVAAGAGAGTYYVATQTEWGKGVIDNIESWVGLKDEDGNVLTNGDGTAVKAPEGAKPMIDEETGEVMRDENGNVLWKLVDSAGNVLESWGGTGTAAVIGAGAVATSDYSDWLLPIGLGVGALLLLR